MDSPEAGVDSPGDGERARILRAAIKLFAALGYDSTAIQQIAEAAGVETKNVGEHFPTKRELYLAVMREVHNVQSADVMAWADGLRAAPPEEKAAALRRLLDGYLDLCLRHPEIPMLWTHRWMADASDIGLDTVDVQPMTPHIIDRIAAVTEPAGIDPQFTTYTIIWCIHGFVLSGVLDPAAQRHGTDDPYTLERFREHMYELLVRAAGLPRPGAQSTGQGTHGAGSRNPEPSP
ncbi:TetR/AcrR family transcriptional regulator [Nonomuraea sp. B12E4]|uniref:TetR/AcrR family transcriptional regulator n=1 Tax=Nonomuraea sp. B12E4 TaxID=3153564 RepID=UPI00325F7ED3